MTLEEALELPAGHRVHIGEEVTGEPASGRLAGREGRPALAWPRRRRKSRPQPAPRLDDVLEKLKRHGYTDADLEPVDPAADTGPIALPSEGTDDERE